MDNVWQEFFERYEDPDPPPGQAKYRTLRNVIAAAIDDGFWRPGDRLPTEQELAAATPYSLGTVQRAMRALADSGIVVRRQGHGTFVSGGPDQVDDPWHYRFLADNSHGFLSVDVLTTTIVHMQDPGRWTRILSQPAPDILRVQRLVNIGNEFLVLSRLYLKADDVGETMARLNNTFQWSEVRKALHKRARASVTQISESVTVAVFPTDTLRLLGVHPRTAGMHIESIARAGRSRTLYFQQLYVPPTRRRLHIATRSHREPERRIEMAPPPTPEEPQR